MGFLVEVLVLVFLVEVAELVFLVEVDFFVEVDFLDVDVVDLESVDTFEDEASFAQLEPEPEYLLKQVDGSQ